MKKQQQLQQQTQHHHGPSNLPQQHPKQQQPQLHPQPHHYYQQKYSPAITGNHQVDNMNNGSTNLPTAVTTSEGVAVTSTKSIDKDYPINSTFVTAAAAHPQLQNVLVQSSLHAKKMATPMMENVIAATSGMPIDQADIGAPSTDGEILPSAEVNTTGKIKSLIIYVFLTLYEKQFFAEG